MKCVKCGKELNEEVRFCSTCGYNFRRNSNTSMIRLIFNSMIMGGIIGSIFRKIFILISLYKFPNDYNNTCDFFIIMNVLGYVSSYIIMVLVSIVLVFKRRKKLKNNVKLNDVKSILILVIILIISSILCAIVPAYFKGSFSFDCYKMYKDNADITLDYVMVEVI